MTKNFTRFTLFVLLVLPVYATRAGTFKDGPAVAYVFGDDVEEENFGFGWQATYEKNRHLSIEFAGLWHEDESRSIADRIPGYANDATVDLDVISLTLTGRVSVEPMPSLLTYVGAGGGYYIINADNEMVRESLSGTRVGFVEADGDKDFGTHLSLGCELVLTRHWELFAEYRHVFLDSGYTLRYAADRDTPIGSRRDSLSYDHDVVRIGLNYRF